VRESCKMAEQRALTVRVPSITNSVTCHNKSSECQICNGLSFELYKAQQEILSYQKVIQVLHGPVCSVNRQLIQCIP